MSRPSCDVSNDLYFVDYYEGTNALRLMTFKAINKWSANCSTHRNHARTYLCSWSTVPVTSCRNICRLNDAPTRLRQCHISKVVPHGPTRDLEAF